ncbi:hypothetical protein [Deinococcus roseus]|uniref:Uncharacterized protein n=1 Tax=Deinococcus roseus TaxID=392414 RepID=A0ABQ2D714_9DEIO|nr:hypothetical protein [Deinococcus roseus]GGJ47300.1 hypothetical protein GCM10008938_36670 [Deinococcus roseus]
MVTPYEQHFKTLIHKVEQGTGNLLRYRSSQYDGKGGIGQQRVYSDSFLFPSFRPVLFLDFFSEVQALEGLKFWVCQPLDPEETPPGMLLSPISDEALLYNQFLYVPLLRQGKFDPDGWMDVLSRNIPQDPRQLVRLENNGRKLFFMNEEAMFRHLAMEKYGTTLLGSPNFTSALQVAARQMRHELLQ